MKHYLKYLAASALLIISATSCDDKLDIVPKGKSTLSTLSDLELLLNQEFSVNNSFSSDLGMICNDALNGFNAISGILATPYSLNYAYLKYDESVDRIALSNEDSRYVALYKFINYMNVVIEKTGGCDGSDLTKRQLIAEAKTLRAYFHYLLVNIHARQYDKANAEEMGGIAYVSSTDVSDVKKKMTVAEVYKHLLDDCSDDVIADMKDYVDDVCRVDKAFGNAVRAKVLFQMKRYAEALPYAQAALKYNNNLEDRSVVMDEMAWNLQNSSVNNYLYMYAGTPACPTFATMPPESVAFFDENDYVRLYELDWSGGSTWSDMNSMMFTGLEGGLCYSGFGPMYNNMGIRTENMYFIIAESLIRTGKIREGLEYLDRVRIKRIENPIRYTTMYDEAAMSEKEAMELVRQFSYIEFIAGYDTFFNCKRWNSETDYKRSITRDLGEYGTFSISPDSPLWVIPFPLSATRYNPTLTQNF